MKDQITTGDDRLEDKLTVFWEMVGGDLFESVFHEWMSRLKWVAEHEREYDVNPH
jgi:hypothetical protein